VKRRQHPQIYQQVQELMLVKRVRFVSCFIIDLAAR
jgi:hypothetical protein